jgi:5'(3')-deoxyribonucleotidase
MTELYGNSQKDPVYGYLENPRELLFIDMDGVLADAEAGMKIWSDKLGLSTDELFKKKLYHMPGFYLDLPPMEGAVESFNKLTEKYEVYILTAPSWENDKSLFTGRALIDDRMKYGVTKFKGEHIHFVSEKFPGWKSVLEYLM